MLTAADRKQLVDLLYQACRENKVLEPFPVVHAVRQLTAHVDQLESKLAKVRAALVEHSPSKALVILDGDVCE